MNVLLTIHDFLPSSRAGSELYTYYLAHELQRSGINVELLFAEHSAEPSLEHRKYEGLSCTVIRKPVEEFHNLFGEQDPWIDRVFYDCVKRFQPDVVHVNHLLHLSTNIPKIARQCNARVVFTLHDYWLRCPRLILLDSGERLCKTTNTLKCTRCCHELYSRYQFYPPRVGILGLVDRGKSAVKAGLSLATEVSSAYRKMSLREHIMRSLADDVDLWIAPSKFSQEAMLAWGLPRQKVVVLPHGMPTRLSAHKRQSRSDARLQFGYIGTIARHKGMHVLLEAFRGIRDADLAIYGHPNAEVYGQFQAVFLQGNVHLKGTITDDDKTAVFSAMDALIVPSICFETFSLVIREAFMAGVPVICSDMGAIKESVRDGLDGLHFRVGSPDDLRRVIQYCIENPSWLRALQPLSQTIPTIEQHVRSRLIPRYTRLAQSPRFDPPNPTAVLSAPLDARPLT